MPQGITASSPRFSPDGQWISFDYRENAGGDSLAVVGRDGQNRQVLADRCTTFCESAWHPTSGEIFFARDDGVNAVAASGGAPRVVYDSFGTVGGIDVSPDGQYLVFREFDPVLYKLSDGAKRELATEDNVYGLRFSPDGKKLVYQDSSTDAIRIRDIETGVTSTLVDTDNYLSSADWFPDGNQLAVITDEGIELFTLQGGAQPERKMLKKGFALKDVDVSPDGKSIAYCINGQRSVFVLTGF
jgi:Tol biopolymer transport system component